MGRDHLMFVVWFILLVIVGLAVMLLPAFALDAISCRKVANGLEVPYHWGLPEGCLLRLDDRWIPLDAYRYVSPR